MKIKLHERKLITLGCTFEENDWGCCQFPKVYRMADGSLAATLHMGEDSMRDYGMANPWFCSTDLGEHWIPAEEDLGKYCGTPLPDGTYLRPVQRPSVDITDMKIPKDLFGDVLPGESLPHPKKGKAPDELPTTTARFYIWDDLLVRLYHIDALPEGLIDKCFAFEKYDPATGSAETYLAPLDWPYMSIDTMTFHNGRTYMPRPSLHGNLKVAPDGSLWAIHYAFGADPKTGGFTPYCTPYILRSTDGGRSFSLLAHIPFRPDPAVDPMAFFREGLPEPEVEFMADGSAIMLIRSCGTSHGGPNFGPMYFTRSTDGGVTWEPLRIFDTCGVIPQMCRLACGVTLAVYGRPGIFVRISEDPSGIVWQDPVEVMTPTDRTKLGNAPGRPGQTRFHAWEGSCCNMGLAVIDDRRAVISYSDFYVPDETGVKRKGCFTHVVEILD